MKVLIPTFILFSSQALYAQASCDVDKTQIESRISEYLSEVDDEIYNNSALLEFSRASAAEHSDPIIRRAREVETRRNREIACDPGEFRDKILESYRAYCKFDEAISQCQLFQRDQEARELIDSASRTLYGLSEVNQIEPSGGAICDSLKEARAQLVSARNVLYSKREKIYKMFTEFKEGNLTCGEATQQNVLSNACLNSFNKEYVQDTREFNLVKRKIRENCKKKHVMFIKSRLTAALIQGAEKTCTVVSGHQQAVKNQRDLEYMYKNFDRTIAGVDESIIGVNKSGQEAKCDLRKDSGRQKR